MAEPQVAAATDIVVRGARTHNLKNIDLALPLGQLIIVTGVSGSGKSSLAFDTIYAEGQRRYVSSLSAYARQFLERMEKPDVDRIEGICPAIAIRQKNSIRNPRSTVGTTTEIHDYMRLLFARVGRTFCRTCGQEVVRETAEIIAKRLNSLPQGTRLLIGFEMPVVDVSAVSLSDAEAVDEIAPLEASDGLPFEPPDSGGGRLPASAWVPNAAAAFGSPAEGFGEAGRSAQSARRLQPAQAPPNHLRQGYGPASVRGDGNELRRGLAIASAKAGGPPKLHAKAEGGHHQGHETALKPGLTSLPRSYVEARRSLGEGGRTNGTESVAATLDALRRKGFHRLYVGGRTFVLDEVNPVDLRDLTVLQVIVDRVKLEGDMRGRLTDSIETAYLEGGGAAFAIEQRMNGPLTPTLSPRGGEGARRAGEGVHVFSERFECRRCEIGYETPQPRLFSFNNPFGACPTCHGFGNIIELDMDLVVPDRTKSIQQGAIEPWTKAHYRGQLAGLKRAARGNRIRLDAPWQDLTEEERRLVIEGDEKDYDGIRGFFRWLERKKYKVHVRVFLSRYRGYLTCPECEGARLRREARDIRIGGRTIDQVSADTVREAEQFFCGLELTDRESAIGDKVLREILKRLKFLCDVGLDYLTLDRLSSTLSGGESQRINLATSLGSALVDTLYVLDEPSIGLHPRDNLRLINILRQLRDQGNTVLVVEHDADMIRVGDTVIDLGLGAGEQGGRVVYAGPLAGLLQESKSLTAKYLREDLAIPVPPARRRGTGQKLRVLGATEHNLKNIDVDIPLHMLTCITGVSGSGKSTLVHDILYAAVKRLKGGTEKRVGAHRKVEGAELIGNVVLVDQTPIGRTPRSNPVTYLKAFDPVREIFAATKDARSRGLTASHFSFNVPGGRCEACQGEGQVRVEMQFLADVFVPCEQCDGKRFKPQVLEVKYRGRNIHQVLDLTVREALTFFGSSPKVLRRLHVLDEIGLGYLRLGQPATTLSGGEAQRIKIASHLASRTGDRILYVLDEPTTGLHFDDIAKLLAAFRKLLEAGHTLVVIEHNLDVIKTADFVVDLGPEGGQSGGRIVASGTPEQVAQVKESHTGRFLGAVLAAGRAGAYARA